MKGPLVFVLVLITNCLGAQVLFKGKVIDSVTLKGLYPVSIENMRTREGVLSEKGGRFEIPVSVGDYLLFKQVGYSNKLVQVKFGDEANYHTIVRGHHSSGANGVSIGFGQPGQYLSGCDRIPAKKIDYESCDIRVSEIFAET
jgi:hypothetical protein